METYQLVWLGLEPQKKIKTLSRALRQSLKDLGLGKTNVLSLLSDPGAMDDRFPAVGIWWGTQHWTPSMVQAAADLMDRGCAILPVVEKLANFSQAVPPPLQPINGFEWQQDASKLAGEILRMFGLTRAQRRAFISYRRTDSRGVAVQLLHALSDHGYQAFLDTASVDFGLDFQDQLMDSLADVDLMLFLDTPNALTSEWVEKELTRAHHLGLGVLQLIWPDWKAFKGTDFCTRFRLNGQDFFSNQPASKADHSPNKSGRLKQATLQRIVTSAEKVRIRSLGSRRTRLTSEVVAAATRKGYQSAVAPSGLVRFTNPLGAAMGAAMPVMGLPKAETLYDIETKGLASGSTRVIYDSLGIAAQRQRFLHWLNRQMPNLQTQPLTTLDTWVQSL